MKPFALCFTGVSGSGKTTLANIVAEQIKQYNMPVQIIDGDILRKQLGNLFGYTRDERERQNRIVRVLAKYLLEQGVNVILAIVTPYEEFRGIMRDFFGESYLEVWTKCPYEVLVERDVKGYYKMAMQNQLKNFNGVNDIFEEPQNADLVINTDKDTPEQCGQQILALIKDRGYIM